MKLTGVALVLACAMLLTGFAVIGTTRTAAATPAQPSSVPSALAPAGLAAPSPSAISDAGWQTPFPLEAVGRQQANLGGEAVSADGSGLVVWQKGGPRATIWATHFLPGAGAAGSDWEVPVQVSNEVNSAYSPAVATDGFGNGIAVWYAWSDIHGYTIYAARFTRGVGWAAPVAIDQGTYYSYYPQVAMNAAGDAVAVWWVWNWNTGQYQTYGNYYIPSSGWGPAAQIDGTPFATYSSRVAIDASGNAIAVWYEYNTAVHTYTVNGSRFSAGSWSPNIHIEGATTYAVYPAVAMDAAGDAIVAWTQCGAPCTVMASRYASGVWIAPVAIDVGVYSAYSYPGPAVAMNNGTGVVAFVMGGPATDPQSVYANVFASGAWSGEQDVDNTLSPAANPSVAVDSTGKALVTYQYTPTTTSSPSPVYNEAVRFNGVTWLGWSLLDYSRVGEGAPLVAMDAAGNALSVWNYNDNGDPTTAPINGILSNRYTASSTSWHGYWQTSPVEFDDQISPSWLQLESNPAGDAIFTWTQNDGPITNAYASLYKPGLGWGPATLVWNKTFNSVTEEWSAIDASGNALTLYRVYDGATWGVYSTYYSTATGWGTPQRLDNMPGDNYWLRIAMSANGDGMAVWQEWNGAQWNVYANRFNGTTHTWSGPTALQSASTSVASDGIAMDAHGDAMVVYGAWDGATYSNYAVQYKYGMGWQAPVLIEQSGTEAGSPSVAMNANGAAVAVWNWWTGTINEAAANTYDPATGWGTETTFNTGPGDSFVSFPAIDGAGHGMVVNQVWENNQWVLDAVTHPTGGSWSAPLRLETSAGDAQGASVALDVHGNGYAAWSQWNGQGWDIAARRFVAGQGWMPQLLVNTPTPATGPTDTGSANIAVDGHGDALLGWNQWSNGALVPYASEYIIGNGFPSLSVSSPSDGTLTKTATVTVTGTTDAGASVTVNGSVVSVGWDGSFSHSYALADGVHTFTIVAHNAAGQTATEVRTVTVDTTAPAVSITAPANGATVSVPTVAVTGTTEPGVRLDINGVNVSVAASGAFSLRLALADGPNTITATATDAAGNTANASVTVTFANPIPGLQQELNNTQGALANAIAGLNRSLALINTTKSDVSTSQASVGTLTTEMLLLVVLVVVSLVVSAVEVVQVRKLRAQLRAAPPSEEPSAPPKS